MQIALLYVSNTPLVVKVCNRFSIGVNDWPLREIESIFVVFDCPKVQLFFCWSYWMLIHMQIVLLKFMEVVMNVYLRYSFNCWRKWLYILRKWTAKGVVICHKDGLTGTCCVQGGPYWIGHVHIFWFVFPGWSSLSVSRLVYVTFRWHPIARQNGCDTFRKASRSTQNSVDCIVATTVIIFDLANYRV